MLELVKEFQTLIAGVMALFGAGIVIITTKWQIRSAKDQEEQKRLQDIRSIAAILAVESEMSLKSAGAVAAIIYQNPGAPIDQDFNFQVFRESLVSLGKLPGALPQQIMYSFQKVISLQELVRERANEIAKLNNPKEMDEKLHKSTVSVVDLASSTVVELAILTAWLEYVAETGESLSLEEALETLQPAFDRVNPTAQQLAIVKIQEVQSKHGDQKENIA